ncbi:Predicted protein [Chitinophaga jiangningensis]|uniref:Phosphodiester glycosidase domain-containing protein n=1 Tax=Chitinophaga jiangningensis TaxID=1419482 RepID=A0A1M6VWB7_9BACT|nr:phosphodiester glycosidase family protein [Chitinophaga jiangningensis]SHK85729.1 Predicted protein [Chitinophaga jiangningensis]
MRIIRLACCLLLSITAVACNKDTTAPVHRAPVTDLAKKITDSTKIIAEVFSDTSFTIAPGIEETDIHYLSQTGYTMRLFILKVDMNKPGIRLQAGTPYGLTPWALQTVPDMAKYIDSTHNRVAAAVNADFFSTIGEPRGIMVKDGKTFKTTWANERSATFIAVLNDGKPFFGTRADFPVMQPQIKDALGAGQLLVKDNVVQLQTDVTIEPRTAAGISADNTLYFAVVDGRNFYYSNGITITDLGMLLKACGAKTVVNLDGGGSSTFMIRHPLAPVWQVRNKPSDGNNRAVGNSWMIINDLP